MYVFTLPYTLRDPISLEIQLFINLLNLQTGLLKQQDLSLDALFTLQLEIGYVCKAVGYKLASAWAYIIS